VVNIPDPNQEGAKPEAEFYHQDTPDMAAMQREEIEHLCQAAGLSLEESRIIELIYVDEKSIDEVARELGLTVAGLEVRINNILLKIKANLPEDYYER